MTKREILKKQEELLWFPQFTNEDGWELGNFVRNEIKKRGFDMSVCIQLNHGYTIFQYGTNGTGLSYQKWMHRKIGVVRTLGMSSFQANVFSEDSGMTLGDLSLNEKDALLRGGAFPIRVKGLGMVGAIAVSGLKPEMDHDFLVDCLASYLGVPDLPKTE